MKRPVETPEDFKARIAAIIGDKSEHIAGARPPQQMLVRKKRVTRTQRRRQAAITVKKSDHKRKCAVTNAAIKLPSIEAVCRKTLPEVKSDRLCEIRTKNSEKTICRLKRHTVSYEARFSLSRSYGPQASPFSPSRRMRRTTNARRGAVDRLVEPPGLTPQFDRPRAPLPQEKTNGFQSPSDLHHDVRARFRNLLKRIGQ